MATENKKVEDTEELSGAWLEEEDDIVEDEETVYGGGSDSKFINGYSVQDVKITMAKRINADKPSKTEWIEIDFINKEEQTHREKFMVRGRDGKTFFMKGKVKTQHFGVNKIKSLIKVLELYDDAKTPMAGLYADTEKADVTYEDFGKEKTEEFLIFNGLIDSKLKICFTSKKVNATKDSTPEDDDEKKYIKACVSATEVYKKANPKKTSLKKFKKDDDYVNVYKWFTETSVAHFCSTTGLFGSEMDKGEGNKMQEFIDANDEGLIFDGRTLIVEDLSDAQKAKLNINDYGNIKEDDDGDYDEPTEEDEDEAEVDDWD